VAGFEGGVAFEKRPCDEGDLLRVEGGGGVLVREMDAVVAGGVVPAAVDIDEAGFACGEGEMAVSLVEVAGGALAFEVEDDVREGVAFEEVVGDVEDAGGCFAAGRVDFEDVTAGSAEGGKVGGPEDAVAPVVDFGCGRERAGEDGLVGGGVDEGEAVGVGLLVFVGADDEGLFGGLEFVADVIDEDLDLSRCGLADRGLGAEAA